MGGNSKTRQAKESRPMDDTPIEDQDLEQDPAEVVETQAPPPAPEPPPAAASAPNAEWAPPVPPPTPKPSKLQLDVMAYGKLSGGQMTARRLALDAEHGSEKVDEAIAKLVKFGLMDAGHVLTARGSELLEQYAE